MTATDAVVHRSAREERGAALASPIVSLDEIEIRRLLPMYAKNAVFMKRAQLRNGELRAVFDTFDHPFSRPLPAHLTREHVLVFATQASYVLASLMKAVSDRWPLGTDEFQRLALAEQATFTRVDMRFTRFIANRDGIELMIKCERFRRMRGRLFARFVFVLPDGCRGQCEGFIGIDNPLQPGRTAFGR